jgi:hypothetical protein
MLFILILVNLYLLKVILIFSFNNLYLIIKNIILKIKILLINIFPKLNNYFKIEYLFTKKLWMRL